MHLPWFSAQVGENLACHLPATTSKLKAAFSCLAAFYAWRYALGLAALRRHEQVKSALIAIRS
jgi:hypothetical protein